MKNIRKIIKQKKEIFRNNTKLKVRFLVIIASLFLLSIGLTTFFSTYSDLILEFNEDPDYVESYARANYNLSKQGEQIFYLPQNDNK